MTHIMLLCKFYNKKPSCC